MISALVALALGLGGGILGAYRFDPHINASMPGVLIAELSIVRDFRTEFTHTLFFLENIKVRYFGINKGSRCSLAKHGSHLIVHGNGSRKQFPNADRGRVVGIVGSREVRQRVVWPDVVYARYRQHSESWALPCIPPPHADNQPVFDRFTLQFPGKTHRGVNGIHEKPCACSVKGFLRTVGGVTSGLGGFTGLSKVDVQQDSTGECQNCAKPSKRYLFFGGVSSPYLGIQIAGLMFAALGFSALVGSCLLRGLDDSYRKGKWYVLAAVSCIPALFFFGWAWAGNPLSAWGLAP